MSESTFLVGPSVLTDMEYDEVSAVDRGANQFATIEILKRLERIHRTDFSKVARREPQAHGGWIWQGGHRGRRGVGRGRDIGLNLDFDRVLARIIGYEKAKSSGNKVAQERYRQEMNEHAERSLRFIRRDLRGRPASRLPEKDQQFRAALDEEVGIALGGFIDGDLDMGIPAVRDRLELIIRDYDRHRQHLDLASGPRKSPPGIRRGSAPSPKPGDLPELPPTELDLPEWARGNPPPRMLVTAVKGANILNLEWERSEFERDELGDKYAVLEQVGRIHRRDDGRLVGTYKDLDGRPRWRIFRDGDIQGAYDWMAAKRAEQQKARVRRALAGGREKAKFTREANKAARTEQIKQTVSIIPRRMGHGKGQTPRLTPEAEKALSNWVEGNNSQLPMEYIHAAMDDNKYQDKLSGLLTDLIDSDGTVKAYQLRGRTNTEAAAVTLDRSLASKGGEVPQSSVIRVPIGDVVGIGRADIAELFIRRDAKPRGRPPGSKNKVKKMDAGTLIIKRQFSMVQREKLAGQGKALKSGGFPIETEQDLKNAIHAIGRAKNPATTRAHIIRHAARLGRKDLIPAGWR